MSNDTRFLKKHSVEIKKAVLSERERITKIINEMLSSYNQKTNIIFLYLDRKYYGINLLGEKLKWEMWKDGNKS